jgi:hypothetical protein
MGRCGPPAQCRATRNDQLSEENMKILALTIGIVSLYAFGVSGAGAQTQSTLSNMAGHHTMDGEVTKVDAKKGWVHLKTSEGTMIVHFPPSALEQVKKGDTMTVNLALKDNGPSTKEKK